MRPTSTASPWRSCPRAATGPTPGLCVDPIVVGAEIVTALQVLISRELNVHDNTVITVGSFHGGSAPNIISRSAKLEATVRNYGEDQRRILKDKITRGHHEHLRGRRGGRSSSTTGSATPSIYNDPALTAEALAMAERVLGSKTRLSNRSPRWAARISASSATIAPAVMFNLGVVPPDLESTAVHSPTFGADEAAIPIGVNLMANIILDHQMKPAGSKTVAK